MTGTRERVAAESAYLRDIEGVLSHADITPMLLYEDAWATSHDLWTAVDGTAEALGQVTQPGATVIIRGTNEPETIVAILACLLGGRIATPVSPRMFDSRADTLAQRAQALVGGDDARGQSDIAVETWNGAVHIVRGNADGAVDRDVAATLMTSGTSGAPKVVPILHRTFARGVEALRSTDGVPDRRPDVNVICFPLYHLSGLFPMLLTFATGRRVALLEKFDASRVADLVEEYGITSLGLTPTTIRMLLDADIAPKRLAPLRYVRSGTAPMPVALAQNFQERFGVPVIQSYGQTESGGEVIGWSAHDMRNFLPAKTGAAGRPRAGINAMVVATGTSAPDGEVSASESGELWLRGIQGRPEWQATGDLARIDEDGFVWIEGRADDVIVCGGFNIAPALLEETLESHPAIARAAVVGVPDARLGAIPVAVVVTDEPVTDDDLDAWCSQQLERYERPRRFVRVDELPLTDTGKVHRPRLRELAAPAA